MLQAVGQAGERPLRRHVHHDAGLGLLHETRGAEAWPHHRRDKPRQRMGATPYRHCSQSRGAPTDGRPAARPRHSRRARAPHRDGAIPGRVRRRRRADVRRRFFGDTRRYDSESAGSGGRVGPGGPARADRGVGDRIDCGTTLGRWCRRDSVAAACYAHESRPSGPVDRYPPRATGSARARTLWRSRWRSFLHRSKLVNGCTESA